MDSSCGSRNLRNLALQLRHYKPPPPLHIEDEEEEADNTAAKVVSQMGLNLSSDPIPKSKPKRAAVLICLVEDDAGGIRVILTKRSSTLSSHSGEVSLPGGKVEEGDADDCDTALREAKEEIGLDPSLVTIATVLQPFVTKYQLTVVPVIGMLYDTKAFKPILNTDEVEDIFYVPLEMFLKDESRRWEANEWMGIKFILHFFDFEAENKKYVIWALTAWILIDAASVVFQQPPQFEVQRPDFKLRSSFTRGDSML